MKILAVPLVAAVLTLSVAPSHAASTSPGKIGVYASTVSATISDPLATVLIATIAKGKKKRVLEVELAATLTGNVPFAGLMTMRPIVNGLQLMEPTNAGSTVTATRFCGGSGGGPLPVFCSQSYEFWLDLDAAQAAHPGMFIKQPLVIEFQLGFGAPGSSVINVDGVATLRARLAKK